MTFNLDMILVITIGVLCLVSAALACHPKNKFSRQTMLLKAIPRAALGIQLLVIPFLYDDITLINNLPKIYSISDQVRSVLWTVGIFFATEVLVQALDIIFGRAEVNK